MPDDNNSARAKLVGINHVALEVGDIDEALEFYGRIFDFTLRSRSESFAAIDIGDQFIALSKCAERPRDEARHFGLVVDDREQARAALEAAGAEILPGRFLDFIDPWGNRIEIIDYRNVQFSKTKGVLRHLGLDALAKTDKAVAEIAEKGLADA